MTQSLMPISRQTCHGATIGRLTAFPIRPDMSELTLQRFKL